MSKKINQLTAATDAQSKNDSYLFALADSINGVALKMTVAQAKEAFGTKSITYTATGTEGTSLTIPTIAGKDILLIGRGIGFIYEIGSSPASDEFTWNDTVIGLGAATNPNEKFLIL